MARYFILSIFLFIFSGCTSDVTSNGKLIPDQKISSSKSEAPLVEDNKLNIAILVPLSTKKDVAASSLINSTQLALSAANNPNVNLIPIDSNLINDNPQNLLNKLTESKVKLIIGPVYASETETLVNLLQGKDITILSLSNDSSLDDNSLLVLGITPDMQAEILTRYAISQGVKKFHLLLPSSKFGKIIDNIVSNLVSEKYQGFYSVSWYSVDNFDQVADKFIKEIPGKADNQTVVFMPQGGKNLPALDNILSKYGVNFRLMGSQAWHHDNLLALRNFERAILLKHQIANSLFMSDYHKYFHKKATNLDWIAYNALLMIAKMDKDNLLLNKQNIILKNGNFDEYSDLRFNDKGIAIYDIPVLEVDNKKFKTMANPQ